MNLLGFVQLAEAIVPFGGYSHCFGIETMAQRHELSTAQQLQTLLKGALHAAIGPADGVASGISFRAARAGDLSEIPDVCHMLSSDRLPLEMRLASLQMGRRLWGVSRGWEWASGVHQQLDSIAEKIELHHAVAFGALVSETTSNQVRAIATYLFQIARNIVLAAVRAIPLDDIAGQRLLSEMQPPIAKLAASCADRSADEIALFPK